MHSCLCWMQLNMSTHSPTLPPARPNACARPHNVRAHTCTTNRLHMHAPHTRTPRTHAPHAPQVRAHARNHMHARRHMHARAQTHACVQMCTYELAHPRACMPALPPARSLTHTRTQGMHAGAHTEARISYGFPRGYGLVLYCAILSIKLYRQ